MNKADLEILMDIKKALHDQFGATDVSLHITPDRVVKMQLTLPPTPLHVALAAHSNPGADRVESIHPNWSESNQLCPWCSSPMIYNHTGLECSGLLCEYNDAKHRPANSGSDDNGGW